MQHPSQPSADDLRRLARILRRLAGQFDAAAERPALRTDAQAVYERLAPAILVKRDKAA